MTASETRTVLEARWVTDSRDVPHYDVGEPGREWYSYDGDEWWNYATGETVRGEYFESCDIRLVGGPRDGVIVG